LQVVVRVRNPWERESVQNFKLATDALEAVSDEQPQVCVGSGSKLRTKLVIE
jgi:hypothetical protein